MSDVESSDERPTTEVPPEDVDRFLLESPEFVRDLDPPSQGLIEVSFLVTAFGLEMQRTGRR